MEPANQKKLQEHLKAIAGILYQEAKTEELERALLIWGMIVIY